MKKANEFIVDSKGRCNKIEGLPEKLVLSVDNLSRKPKESSSEEKTPAS